MAKETLLWEPSPPSPQVEGQSFPDCEGSSLYSKEKKAFPAYRFTDRPEVPRLGAFCTTLCLARVVVDIVAGRGGEGGDSFILLCVSV